MTLNHILVATDFSPDAEAAVTAALDLATSAGASVDLLHVVEDPLATGMWGEDYTADIASLQRNLIHELKTRLGQSVPREERTKIPISHGVRTGRVAPTVVDVARETHADLIVLGAHGRARMSRLLIGGVAERVVRTAPCPVLTIHTRHARTPGGTARAHATTFAPETILVPTDFSEPSDRALDDAKALATRFGAALHLVHVLQEPFPSGTDVYVAEVAEIRERLLQEAHRRLAAAMMTVRGIAVTSSILKGPPAEQIIEAAADTRADLIVMGTHGRGGVAHLLMGSVAERVVRTASCAVWTVRATTATTGAERAYAKAVVWK